MHFLTYIAVVVSASQASTNPTDVVIPPEFRGVWKITAATDHGVNQPLAEDPDGSLSVGECGILEVVICETRVIIVETDGDATVGQTRIIATEPELKIELRGYGYHAKQNGPSFAILKLIDEQTMQLAFCEQSSRRVNTSTVGHQFVVTATR